MRVLEWLAILCAAVAFFVYAHRNWNIASTTVLGFSADSAIPVRMLNDGTWDLYRLFFYGQDRFGAWPFFLLHGVSRALHFTWTPELAHAVLSAVLITGVFPAGLLGGRFRLASAAGYLFGVFAPTNRTVLFELAQVYPWQLPALLWAWWGVRCLLERPRSSVRWGIAAAGCLLATWLVPWSAEVLLAVSVVESIRVGQPLRPLRATWKKWTFAFTPALVGLLGENVLRGLFHSFAKRHYGSPMSTTVGLDWRNLGQNGRHILATLHASEAFYPLLGVALFALVATLRWLRGEPRAHVENAARFELPSWGWTVWGAAWVALIPLPLLVLLTHFRLNDYASRYFVPSFVMAIWGAFLLGCGALQRGLQRHAPELARVVPPILLLAGFAGTLPSAGRSPQYDALVAFSRKLGAVAPAPLLINGYWGAYAYAGIAQNILPLPAENEWNRMPWLKTDLAKASVVWVGSQGPLATPPGVAPHPWLFQYGQLLLLQDVDVLSWESDRISTYLRLPLDTLAATFTPDFRAVDFLAPSGSLAVSFPASSEAELFITFRCMKLGPRTRVTLVNEDGTLAPAAVDFAPRALHARAPSKGARVKSFELVLEFPPDKDAFNNRCQLRSAQVVRRPSNAHEEVKGGMRL